MLKEEYSIESIFSNSSDICNKNGFQDYNKEFNLNDEDILSQLKPYGISFDIQELEYYRQLYSNLNKNPNLIELFDLCQSNSEHSRHWYFNGEYNIDGNIQPESLFKLVKNTLKPDSNSLVNFSDNFM